MDPSEGDEAARDELLTKRVRGTAGGAWERDGDQLRDSLRHAWKLWIEGGKPPTGPQREFIERCLGLLCKDTVGKQSESLDLVAQFLVGLPSETAVELRNQLKGSAVLMLELQAPTAAARALFARAAERETDYGFGHVLYFGLAGLPHSLGLLARRLHTATTGKPELTKDYQRILLTCQDKDCLSDAFRLLYLGPGTQWAVASLEALEEADAPVEVWLGVGRAALERPKLQAPLMDLLLKSPRPFLMTLVAWVWVYGAPSAHGAAENLLKSWGTAAELPILRQQVPLATELLESCKTRPGTTRLFSLINALPPWTATDRLFAGALIGGAPVGDQALRSLRELGKSSSVATIDLLLELVESLEFRMVEPEVSAIFLEKCVESQSLRLLQGVGAVLVRAAGRGMRVPGEQRAILAKRATEVVEGVDSSLCLARLALPQSLPFWREHRKKLLPPTCIPEEDQALAFALLPLEPQALQVVYEDATPNQRRLLVARANFATFPLAAPVLLRWLSAEDPSSLPVFLERMLEQKPEGVLAVLIDLTGQDIPDTVRKDAVKAIGELGGRAELMVLGSLVGVDTTGARAAILQRLSAQGQDLQGGALEIASTGGELVAAESSASSPSPPPPSPSVPKDPRKRLLPPPRSISPAIFLSYLVLAPNGWGLIWTNLALAVIVSNNFVRDEEITSFIMGILPFFFNHFLCRTDQELRALRSGVLLAATVEVEASRPGGKKRAITWHHRLRLLGDDGRLHQHTITDSGRLDALLDEKHELVLAVLNPSGAPEVVQPIDSLRLIEVNDRGLFRTRPRTWGLLALGSLPWWPVLYDFLT